MLDTAPPPTPEPGSAADPLVLNYARPKPGPSAWRLIAAALAVAGVVAGIVLLSLIQT